MDELEHVREAGAEEGAIDVGVSLLGRDVDVLAARAVQADRVIVELVAEA